MVTFSWQQGAGPIITTKNNVIRHEIQNLTFYYRDTAAISQYANVPNSLVQYFPYKAVHHMYCIQKTPYASDPPYLTSNTYTSRALYDV